MIKVSGAKSKIKFVTRESIYGESYEDIQRRVPKVEKMNRILGVKAETSLEEGLRETWEWFKAFAQ
jgi:UDP-glucose 4-epimerase